MESNFSDYVKSRLWLWPVAALLVAIPAAVATVYADARAGDVFASEIITGDPDTARAILSVICGAMVNVVVFTFTLAMVVVQLANTQYSPRLTRALSRDRPTKASLGLFVATFAYASVVLHAVSSGSDRTFVPELSLVTTYGLVLASLFAFIFYIDHVVQSVRVGSIISRLADETCALIAQSRPRLAALTSRPPPRTPDLRGHWTTVCCGERSGTLNSIQEERLVELARERRLLIELLHRVGDYVPYGVPVARVHGGELEAAAVLDRLSFGTERTMQQDISYGLRQLVDVASRALSPAVNDPTTAVQCIDRIHEVLRRLVELPDAPSCLGDRDGVVRLIVPRVGWDDYVALGVTEPRVYGSQAPQVTRRLEAMLRDLRAAAPPERRAPVDHQLRALERSVDRSVAAAEDRALSKGADEQGLGAAPSPH